MEILRSLDWQLLVNILDVLLVSFIVYKVLLIVKGTRGQPMLLGLGIVMLVYVLAKYFSLVTLSWILGNFLGSVILVVVVLFQDDLRRALIKVGLIGGFALDSPGEIEGSIQEISESVAELSRSGTGALVVITRDVGLDEYTEHAIQLDAIVTRQLIVSIFQLRSPLHDGAIVIDRGRIIAAGAVLPLTFNPEVSPALGTRHRAAIGLSERTDALMVVVSEETGQISLIREGCITRNLDTESLKAALSRLLLLKRKTGKKSKVIAQLADKVNPGKLDNINPIKTVLSHEMDQKVDYQSESQHGNTGSRDEAV